MKRIFACLLIIIMLFSLSACGKKEEAVAEPAEVTVLPAPMETMVVSIAPVSSPTPSPEPMPIQPELPEVVDQALFDILDSISADVQPGSAGSSLRAAQCAARLLDWGLVTELSDDEIYSAVGCWLDRQSDEGLVAFFDSFYSVYDASYDLRGENGESLLRDAGMNTQAYPWNEQAARAVEMVCYGCGLR